MKVTVLCTAQQQEELLLKPTNPGVELAFCTNGSPAFQAMEGDVLFDLKNEAPIPSNRETLVFVNAVSTTLKELPGNCIRMNGWNGFLKREILELVATEQQQQHVEETMNKLGWGFRFVPDQPGMVAPRIIAMIVNEAYFGLEDGISTKGEIDTAMKLGTNYPHGPFEWAEKIGKQEILHLLQTLEKQDSRYRPSQLLVDEATHSTIL